MRLKIVRAVAIAGIAALATSLVAACSDDAPTTNKSGLVLNVASTGDPVQRVFNPFLPVTAYGHNPVPDPAEDEKTIDVRLNAIIATRGAPSQHSVPSGRG